MTFNLGRLGLFLIISTYLILSASTSANAKKFDAEQIKSAYLVNFFKHITWPDDVNKNSYQLGIYKEQSYVRFLTQSLQNKKIKNKRITVFYVEELDELKRADSVYIPEQFNDELHDIANALRGTNTLLISDNSLNKHDVMINLIQQENSAVISFEVNKSNIIYEKLTISANLLLLGGSELDVATLYRETEVAMQKTRVQSIELKRNLLEQQQRLGESVKQLAEAEKSLVSLNRVLSRNAKAAQQQKLELAQLKLSVLQKQEQLDQQRLTLNKVSQQSMETESELRKQQDIFAEKSKENKEILAIVEQNKSVLTEQKVELAKHKRQLKDQDVELSNKIETISNQKQYLLLTTIVTTITILAALLIVFFFKKNQKTTKELSHTLANLNETQEQLVQSEKMASLGRLVAGVAHEINTPLSIAITANSLVLDDTLEIKDKIASAALSKGRMDTHISKSEESLVMSENALERVKILLANFKLVAADQIVSEQRKINLAKYINEVMSTLSVELKKQNVSYHFNGPEDLMITTIPGVFSQVLSNLVMNSIIHGFDKRHEGNIFVTLMPPSDKGIELHYNDDGLGMDEHTLENIFEPFFTTKRGKGSTGLGMNIVYNLVNQQLKGSIVVETHQGDGTFITLTLPETV
jgi:signal transduction histidine kinase